MILFMKIALFVWIAVWITLLCKRGTLTLSVETVRSCILLTSVGILLWWFSLFADTHFKHQGVYEIWFFIFPAGLAVISMIWGMLRPRRQRNTVFFLLLAPLLSHYFVHRGNVCACKKTRDSLFQQFGLVRSVPAQERADK